MRASQPQRTGQVPSTKSIGARVAGSSLRCWDKLLAFEQSIESVVDESLVEGGGSGAHEGGSEGELSEQHCLKE